MGSDSRLYNAVLVSNGQVIVQFLTTQGAQKVIKAVTSGNVRLNIASIVGPCLTPTGYMVQFYIGADPKDTDYAGTVANARDAVRNIARATINSRDIWQQGK